MPSPATAPASHAERHRGAARTLREGRVELAHQTRLDELVDQAGHGGPREAGVRGHLGAGHGRDRVDDGPQRDREILVSHLLLAGHGLTIVRPGDKFIA